jgi:hypothetical protein
VSKHTIGALPRAALVGSQLRTVGPEFVEKQRCRPPLLVVVRCEHVIERRLGSRSRTRSGCGLRSALSGSLRRASQMLARSIGQVFAWRRVAGSVRRLRGSGGERRNAPHVATSATGPSAPLVVVTDCPACRAKQRGRRERPRTSRRCGAARLGRPRDSRQGSRARRCRSRGVVRLTARRARIPLARSADPPARARRSGRPGRRMP